MLEVQSIDLTGLMQLTDGIRSALIGTGRDGDASTVLVDETRRLAIEIANEMPPRSKAAGTKKVEKDVKSFLAVDNGNLDYQHRRSSSDVVWIAAGPNFLTCVNKSDYQVMGAPDDVLRAMRVQQKRGTLRGKKMVSIGQRGVQHVYRIARTLVERFSFDAVLAKLMSKVGQLKASFAETGDKLGEKRIPQWVKVHFPSSKSVTDLSGLATPEQASITFGSRAPGVSKEFVQQKVRHSVEVRKRKMISRLDRILNGYAEDHNAGRRPRKRGHDDVG